MAPKKALTARNLEALGAERLAELLIEFSRGKTAAKRLFRLELVDAEGRAELAREDAAEALDLMWQFMGLANSTLDRCEDSAGSVIDVFRAAADLGEIAYVARPDPHKLVDRTFEALTQNAHGQYNDLIGVLTPALGQQGSERLKQWMIELSNTPVAQLPRAHRPRIRWPYSGTAHEDEIADRMRLRTARSALQNIADPQGDVDAFIDQHDEDTRKVHMVAAGFACRLLGGGPGRGGPKGYGGSRTR